MEKYWTDAFTGGPEKAHQILFLWDGFHFNDLGVNARDAEYSEGRKQNLRDILMATGVHPAIMMQENSSKAGASAAEYLFAKYTLSPLLERIRQRINSEVMPSYGNKHDFRFIDVVPRDTIQATSANVAYLDRGVMLINEVRTQIGLPQVDWGDITWPELRAKLQTEMRGNAGSRDNQPYLDQNSQRDVAREHNQMAGRTSTQRDTYDPYQT